MFGFLKSDPNVNLVAQQKTTSPPNVAKAFSSAPKISEVTSASSTKSAPVVVPKPKAAADSSGGFFGFLSPKSVDIPPVVVAEKKAVTTVAKTSNTIPVENNIAPAVVKVSPKISSTKQESQSGGVFGFLSPKSPTKPTTTTTAPVIEKPAPVIAKSAAPSPTTASTGGFFGFLSPKSGVKASVDSKPAVPVPVVSKPAPVIAKPAPIIVKPAPVIAKPAPIIVKPAPVIAKPVPVAVITKPTTKVDNSGGLFGFLSPKPIATVPVTTTTAVRPNPVVVKSAPVPIKPIQPNSDSAGSGGFFGFLSTPKPTTSSTTKPAPVTAKPAPVIAKPAPVIAKPSPVIVKPVPVIVKPAPVIIKPAPVIIKPAPVVAKAVPPVTISTGGFFGFLSPKTDIKVAQSTTTAVGSKTVIAKAAPVVAKPAPVIVKPTVVVSKSAPVVTKTAIVSKTAQAGSIKSASVDAKSEVSGGFFGFLQSKPVSSTSTPSTTTAAAAAGSKSAVMKAVPVYIKPAPIVSKPEASIPKSTSSGGFFGSSFSSKPQDSKVSVSSTTKVVVKPVVKSPTPVAPKVTPVTKASPTTTKITPIAPVTPKSEVTGGFFGFLNPKPAVPAPKDSIIKSTGKSSTSMNAKFLSLVSTSLKKDASKIVVFQKTTDSYRAGNINATAFIKALENLFGEALLDSIITPLILELPEKSLADKLKKEFESQKLKKGKK